MPVARWCGRIEVRGLVGWLSGRLSTGQVLLEDGTPKLAPHLWPARRRLGSCIVHASFMHFWWEGLVDVGGNVDGGGDLSKPMDNGAAKDRVLQRLPALPHPLSGSCLVHAASRGLWPDQQHFLSH